jgi:hypothetical protein
MPLLLCSTFPDVPPQYGPERSAASRFLTDFHHLLTTHGGVPALARAGGNFRLVHRPRLLEINELRTVTREVVEAPRETLVIGR